MIEKWVDITGFEGLYRISDHGKVKSLAKTWVSANGRVCAKGETVLKPDISGEYLRVTLCKDSVQYRMSIHRIVAQHFIPNPNNLPFVNHKFGDKHDNRASELEWCTASENMQHADKMGLRKMPFGETLYNTKISDADVRLIRELYSTHKMPQKQLAQRFGVCKNTISRIVTKRRRCHVS